LVKPIARICSQGFYRNLFHNFPRLIVFSMYIRTLYNFLPNLRPSGAAQRPIWPGRRSGAAHWARRRMVTAPGARVVARPPMMSGGTRWSVVANRALTRVSPPHGQGEGSGGSPTGSYNGGWKRGWRDGAPSIEACSGGRRRQREAPAAWV
jgi:hypothetical protein